MVSGTRLGRYVVRRRIGAGGFATVWLCHDEQLDSPVAVKVLADNWSVDAHVRQRFLEEGRFLRKVDSPHVVPVYDAGELEDGRPFLVMAYADQGNLADRLELSTLPPGQSLQVVGEVGAGLHALHQRGVLHRDVKPANVLFRSIEDDEGAAGPRVRAMVGDLGLGKALEASSRLTMVAGTPAYVAPEQARGEHLDPRADQFSLAALAFLLLQGRPPFEHASLSAAAAAPAPPELAADLPRGAGAVLRRGMAADREERYADIPELVAALAAALEGTVVEQQHEPWLSPDPDLAFTARATPPSTTAVVQDAAPSRPRRRWPLVAASIALVAGAAGGWWLGRETAYSVTVRDDSGSLAVTVPDSWARVQGAGPWRPPGADSDFLALSAGSGEEWQRDARASGVFLGMLAGTELPQQLPGHADCRSVQGPVRDHTDQGATLTTISSGCTGGSTVMERVVQVADNRLLWVQVQSVDRPAATSVLDSVEVSGF